MPLLTRSPRLHALARPFDREDLVLDHPVNIGLLGWWLAQPQLFQSPLWPNIVDGTYARLTDLPIQARFLGWQPTQRPGGVGHVAYTQDDAGYVTLPSPVLPRLIRGSIAAWINIRTPASFGGIFQSGEGVDVSLNLDFNGTAVELNIFDGGVQTIVTPFELRLDQWYHLVGTWDGVTQRLYVDGVQVASGAAGPVNYPPDTGVAYFGTSFAGSGPFFDGTQDDYRVYDYALAANTVRILHIESQRGYPGALAHRRLRGIAQTAAADQALTPPAIPAVAQVPMPMAMAGGGYALIVSAISARAQVQGFDSTKVIRLSAIRARTRVPTATISIQRANRPDNPALASTFVPGDWLVQAPTVGIKWSFDYQDATLSWDHRLLDISPIEVSVPRGGGIATVGNVTLKIAEDGAGQSILQLWDQYPALNGAPITIDLFIAGAESLPEVSNPLRIFTGKIDTIAVRNAVTELLCVDDSLQQNLLIPQTLVTSMAFPNAASAAYGQPEPLIYGAGSNIGAAPMLLVDIPTNTYLIAGHPMYLGSANIAVYDQANTLFLEASGVVTFTNNESALVTFGAFNAGVLSWGSAVGVTDGGNVVDGNSTTLAIINTGTLDSNAVDGYGTLGVFEVNPGTPNVGTLQISLVNHRRSPDSDPTVTGTFYVQTVSPATGNLLRTLFTTSAYRHVTSAQTDVIILSNVRVAINEQLEVLLIARNEGSIGTTSQTYEIGEVQVEGLVLYSAFSAGLTTMTLPINTQEIRFNSISYVPTVDVNNTDPFVITPNNAVDFSSTTYAIIPTCNLDSNLDGIGRLAILTPVTPAQLGNNTLSIDFTNHRRVLSSTPTVTGTFYVQTVNPATTTVIRDNLFVGPPYRQTLNPLSTSFTATAINLGANTQLGVYVLARNEGGVGSYNAGTLISTTILTSTVSFVAGSTTSTTVLTDTISVVTTFGTTGGANGQFSNPGYLARDSASNLWVVDRLNDRVQQFDASGTYLGQFGTAGLGLGQFGEPVGIAIDAVNQIFIADRGKARILVFDSAGGFLNEFGTTGPEYGQFRDPWGIAAAPDGSIWVTDRQNETAQNFTSTGTWLFAFGGTQGTAEGQFHDALGIAIDAGGTLWIADGYNFRVQAFTSTGTFLRQIGTQGTGRGQFTYPLGVATGLSGTIWVTDEVNNTFQRFTSAGSWLMTAGEGGAAPGQFNGPYGVVTGESNLVWVVDENNNRVQQFMLSYTSSVVIVSNTTAIYSFTSSVSVGMLGADDAYEIGEIGIKSFYQPAGGNLPVFLFGGSWMGRFDDDGTILSYAMLPSGTFFHTPDQVIASILIQDMGRSVTTSAFNFAYNFYTTNNVILDGGIGAGWAVTRDQARKVLGDAAQQAGAILFPNFDNSFKLIPFQSGAQVHLAFALSNILLEDGADRTPAGPWSDTMQVTLGNLQLVHNTFEVRYAYNAGSRTYGKILSVTPNGSTLPDSSPYKEAVEELCADSFTRHGYLQPLMLEAYWIADDASAEFLLNFLVNYFAEQRTFVEFDTTLYAASLQLGDLITVTHPFLPSGDNGGTFEVHTIRYLPLTGRMHLVASKPAVLPAPLEPLVIRARVSMHGIAMIESRWALLQRFTQVQEEVTNTGLHIINAFGYFTPGISQIIAVAGDPFLVAGLGALPSGDLPVGEGFNDVYTASRLLAASPSVSAGISAFGRTTFPGTLQTTGSGNFTTALLAVASYASHLYVAFNTADGSNEAIQGPPFIARLSSLTGFQADAFLASWISAREFTTSYSRIGALGTHGGALHAILEPDTSNANNTLDIWRYDATVWLLVSAIALATQGRALVTFTSQLYAGLSNTVYRYDGTSWLFTTSFASARTIDAMASALSTLYVTLRNVSNVSAVQREIWQSSNGTTFTLLQTFSEIETSPFTGALSPGATPGATGRLYATIAQKVYSYDGVTWTSSYQFSAGSGASVLGITALRWTPESDNRLYAALSRRFHISDEDQVPDAEIWYLGTS